jgi:hypothetical protein
MSEICQLFACVYALKNGCSINGWMDNEGELNGKKCHCNIYDVMCITAKCKACGHEGIEGCKKV